MFVRDELTHDESRGIQHQPSHGSTERDRVRRGGKNALQHNNGMHPTGISGNVIRATWRPLSMLPGG